MAEWSRILPRTYRAPPTKADIITRIIPQGVKMSQSSGNQLKYLLQIRMREAITQPILKGGIRAFHPRYFNKREMSQLARIVGIINPNPTIASLCLIKTEEIFKAG